jgi:hypothetical protein
MEQHASAFTPSVLEQWRRRENLLPGLALLVLTVVGWAYVGYQASTIGSMHSMSAARISTMGGFISFVLGAGSRPRGSKLALLLSLLVGPAPPKERRSFLLFWLPRVREDLLLDSR